MTIKAVVGDWFLDNENYKLPPINIIWLGKKKQNKEDNIKIKLQQANDHWNYWRLQLNCKKLEWVYTNNQDHKNNP